MSPQEAARLEVVAEAPPPVPSDVETRPARWRRASKLAVIGLGAGLAGMLLAAIGEEWVEAVGLVVMFAGGFFGLVTAIIALVQLRRAKERASTAEKTVVVALTSVLGLIYGLLGAGIAWIATVGFARGRQLRRFGKVLLPEVREGDAWAKASRIDEVPAELRAPLAARWRENGRTEHASVAAFARLTLDLMALGAPPRLLHDAQKDADDEIRHTELCFALARALDGEAESPAAFPQAARARTLSRWRTIALAQLAVDSLIDGALHEGVSARVIAQLAQRCEVPEVRAVLKQLAADEGRHSAHGWDVVEWCLAEGGAVVAWAVRGALRTIPRTLRTPVPDGARDGAWERLGIHGHALEAQCYADARSNLVTRVERICAPRVLRAA